jgi:hypothetical protein
MDTHVNVSESKSFLRLNLSQNICFRLNLSRSICFRLNGEYHDAKVTADMLNGEYHNGEYHDAKVTADMLNGEYHNGEYHNAKVTADMCLCPTLSGGSE